MPTFEVPPPIFHDSNSNFSGVLDELGDASRSSHSTFHAALHGEGHAGHLGNTEAAAFSKEQKAGEKSESDDMVAAEAAVDGDKEAKSKISRNHSGRTRGVSVTRSFLSRGRKKQEEGADQTKETEDDRHNSKIGFFGRFHKKEKDESDSDEEKSRFVGRKKVDKCMAHQALDDEGSDQD